MNISKLCSVVHPYSKAIIFGRGPSLLNSDFSWVSRVKATIFACNDAIVGLPRADVWLFADRHVIPRCWHKHWKKAKTILVAQGSTSDLVPSTDNIFTFDARSPDWIHEHNDSKKYIAGLFTGPAACMWLASKMRCKEAWLFGCDGYAQAINGRIWWYGLTGHQNRPFSPHEALRWGGGQPVPIWNRHDLLMYPKHQRYGCGFFEMMKYLRGKIDLYNTNSLSIYGIPKRQFVLEKD